MSNDFRSAGRTVTKWWQKAVHYVAMHVRNSQNCSKERLVYTVKMFNESSALL